MIATVLCPTTNEVVQCTGLPLRCSVVKKEKRLFSAFQLTVYKDLKAMELEIYTENVLYYIIIKNKNLTGHPISSRNWTRKIMLTMQSSVPRIEQYCFVMA